MKIHQVNHLYLGQKTGLKNDESRGRHNTNSQIKFKISMLKSSLHDCSDAYIHVQGTITIPNTGTAAAPNNRKKKLIFKKMCSIY